MRQRKNSTSIYEQSEAEITEKWTKLVASSKRSGVLESNWSNTWSPSQPFSDSSRNAPSQWTFVEQECWWVWERLWRRIANAERIADLKIGYDYPCMVQHVLLRLMGSNKMRETQTWSISFHGKYLISYKRLLPNPQSPPKVLMKRLRGVNG